MKNETASSLSTSSRSLLRLSSRAVVLSSQLCVAVCHMSCGRDVAYTVRPRARHVIGLSVSSVLECWMIVALATARYGPCVRWKVEGCATVPCLGIEWLTQGGVVYYYFMFIRPQPYTCLWRNVVVESSEWSEWTQDTDPRPDVLFM